MMNQPRTPDPVPNSTGQPHPEEPGRFDGKRIKQLVQDKRFVTFLSGAGVCLILICYYFIKHTNPDGAPQPASSLNANLPQAGDSTGLPARSKLELAAAGQPLALPDQRPMERGLNASVPGSLRPALPPRGEADSYIYGAAVPPAIYQEPDTTTVPPVAKKSRPVASSRAEPEDDDNERATLDQAELEKNRKLLALLQEYKADKLRRQQEAQTRLLKPEAYAESAISSLNGSTGRNSFYGLQSDRQKQQLDARDDSLSITVKAMVFSEQTIVSGGRVTLRLLESITLRGRLIPEGTRLYGVANFGGQRVTIAINQVQLDERILPLKLAVYDMDGLPGIYVPNVLALQQGRQAVAQAGQGINVSLPGHSATMPALAAASAVQAGLQGGRSFLARKVAVPKATLKNNYYVLLK